jgi:hypothetical protein
MLHKLTLANHNSIVIIFLQKLNDLLLNKNNIVPYLIIQIMELKFHFSIHN